MQGLEEELIAKLHNSKDEKEKPSHMQFIHLDQERQHAHLVNRMELREKVVSLMKSVVYAPYADPNTYTELNNLNLRYEDEEGKFIDRKQAKYLSLLRKLKLCVLRDDKEGANTIYAGIQQLKSAKKDLRMQTLEDQINNLEPSKPMHELLWHSQLDLHRKALESDVERLERNKNYH